MKTLRERMEAWQDAQGENRRTQALHFVKLDYLYSLIVNEGETSVSVFSSLQATSTQTKLLEIGIDMDRFWVEQAKNEISPERDWIPEVETRFEVIERFRPYYEKIGGAILTEFFLGGLNVHHLFRPQRKTAPNLPSYTTVKKLLQFCVDDVKEGGARKQWTGNFVVYRQIAKEMFGDDENPFRDFAQEEQFLDWIKTSIPYEKIDYMAKQLNHATGTSEFAPHLFVQWHKKGNRPGRKKFALLLQGFKTAFPQWLPGADGELQKVSDFTPRPPAVHKEEPKQTQLLIVAETFLDRLKTVLEPSEQEQALIRQRRQTLQQIQEVDERLLAIRKEQVKRLEQWITEHPERTQTVTDEEALVAGREAIGKNVNGLSFILTEDSFKEIRVFTLKEIDDTLALIKELARRFSLINSMKPADKRSVIKLIERAFREVIIQVRQLNCDERLPAFQDMELAALMWGDEKLSS